MKVRNTFIIFIVSGFWHGANWTFIVWGALNAIYFLPLLLTQKNRTHLGIVAQGRYLPRLKDVLTITFTFSLTVLAWIFFRAENIQHAFNYILSIGKDLSSFGELRTYSGYNTILLLLAFFIFIEWFGREQRHAIENIKHMNTRVLRWACYMCIGFMIFLFKGQQQQFIYFQF
jgi:hypothetical protein